MVWLYILILIIGAVATYINIRGIITLIKRNKIRRDMFRRYEAKFELVGGDFKTSTKVYKQFKKEWDELGGNYEIDVVKKVDDILDKYL